MAQEGLWTIPDTQRPCCDSDFGATPGMFTVKVKGVQTDLVAACNKNGYLYVLRQDDLGAGPLWSRKIDAPKQSKCLAAAVFDGTSLYQGASVTNINGVRSLGALRKLNGATGATTWQTGIPAQIVAPRHEQLWCNRGADSRLHRRRSQRRLPLQRRDWRGHHTGWR